MKLDIKISPYYANLNRDYMLSISSRIHTMPNKHMRSDKRPKLVYTYTTQCIIAKIHHFLDLQNRKKKIAHVIMIITKTNNIKIEKPRMLHRCKMAIYRNKNTFATWIVE